MNLNQIDSCFGIEDAIFAGHPYDEERAFELLKFCRENNVSLSEILDAAKNYLETQTTNDLHIQEQ